MWSEQYPMQIGIFCNELHLCESTYISWVRPQNIYCISFYQLNEILPQINLLSRVDWCCRVGCDLLVEVG